MTKFEIKGKEETTMWIFGPPNVEKLKAKKDVKGLIKALWYNRDPKIGGDAAPALGHIGDSRALEPLTRYLFAADREYASSACVALANLGDHRAIDPLVRFIKREEKNRKYNPAASQKNIKWACEALGKLCTRSIEPLTALFASIETRHRSDVIYAIGRTALPEALDWLITNMYKYDPGLRGPIIKSLQRIGDRRALESLVAALMDEDVSVRWNAVQALEKLDWKPDRSKAAAYYWVAKEHWKRAVALGSLAIEPLIIILWDDGASKAKRQSAAEALAEIGTPSVEPVIAAIANPDKYWSQGLGRKAGHGNVWKDHTLRPITLDYCIEMMVKIGRPAIERLTVAYNKWNNPHVHQVVFEALERSGWTPGHDETAALYWMVKGRWDKVVALGATAVDPLIAVISDVKNERQQLFAGIVLNVKLPRLDSCAVVHVRRCAAKAMVQLYHETALDEQSKREILALRDTVTKRHADKTVETDRGCYSYHTDNYGVGVEFPL